MKRRERAIDALRMVTTLLPFRVGDTAVEIPSACSSLAVPLASLGLALFFFANGFERPMLRWSVSHQRRKFHFTGDGIRCFKFSLARQCPRVDANVAEHKFHLARKCDGVPLIRDPFRLGRLSTSPNFRLRVRHRQCAFPIALCIKAQETVLLVSESNLNFPTTSCVRRICLGQDEGECVHDHCQNYRVRCFHVFF